MSNVSTRRAQDKAAYEAWKKEEAEAELKLEAQAKADARAWESWRKAEAEVWQEQADAALEADQAALEKEQP